MDKETKSFWIFSWVSKNICWIVQAKDHKWVMKFLCSKVWVYWSRKYRRSFPTLPKEITTTDEATRYIRLKKWLIVDKEYRQL